MIDFAEWIGERWNDLFGLLNQIRIDEIGMGWIILAVIVLSMFLGILFRTAKY